jgi:hypothetical protein
MPSEEAMCTQLILLVSNLCAFVATFLAIDRYIDRGY